MQVPSIENNLVDIILVLLGTVLWFFREKILLKLKIWYFKFRNRPQKINITHIRKYKNRPVNWLSKEIFKDIKQVNTHSFEKKGINDRCIYLQSINLGIPITIWLNEEFDTSTINGKGEPTILDYVVSIKTDSDLRIGYSDIHLIQEFITVSIKIQSIIHKICFSSQEPIQEFVICDINQELPFITKEKLIKDDRLATDIKKLEGNIIHIVSEEPTYVTEAIRKYFVL